MRPEEVSRRDFHKLSTAALCGLIAGTAFGCADQSSPPAKTSSNTTPPPTTPPPTTPPPTTPPPTAPPTAPAASTKTEAKTDGKSAVAVTTVGLHACRGLNECKGLGKSKKNDCAGKGDCYTVTHSCSGQNDCKFQGGCGGDNGLNDCKGKGGCGHFPIADNDVWKKARVAFESREKAAGKKFGPAPAPTKI
jgi:hypothetical protein